MSSKIARHLERHHKNERVMKEILSLDDSKKSERKKRLDGLRMKGDFFFNAKVLKSGEGRIITYRRPQNGCSYSPEEYVPCKYCLAFLHKREIRRHCASCAFRPTESTGNMGGVQNQCELLLYPHQQSSVGSSLELQEFVLRSMNNDSIKDVLQQDELILTYGSFLLSGKGAKKANNISQRMRTLSRLVIKMREIAAQPNWQLVDIIVPKQFDNVVVATKELAGYSATNIDGEKLPIFKKPSLALKMGYALDNALMLLQGMGLRKGNPVLVENAKNFQKLYESEWSVLISSASLRALADNKFNKDELLPLTSDLVKLRQYCEDRMTALRAELLVKVDSAKWRELADIVLTRITIFNKRRGNEPSSLLLSRYVNRKSKSAVVHDDIIDSLSPMERKLLYR